VEGGVLWATEQAHFGRKTSCKTQSPNLEVLTENSVHCAGMFLKTRREMLIPLQKIKAQSYGKKHKTNGEEIKPYKKNPLRKCNGRGKGKPSFEVELKRGHPASKDMPEETKFGKRRKGDIQRRLRKRGGRQTSNAGTTLLKNRRDGGRKKW